MMEKYWRDKIGKIASQRQAEIGYAKSNSKELGRPSKEQLRNQLAEAVRNTADMQKTKRKIEKGE